jgi:hypothetical protein
MLKIAMVARSNLIPATNALKMSHGGSLANILERRRYGNTTIGDDVAGGSRPDTRSEIAKIGRDSQGWRIFAETAETDENWHRLPRLAETGVYWRRLTGIRRDGWAWQEGGYQEHSVMIMTDLESFRKPLTGFNVDRSVSNVVYVT